MVYASIHEILHSRGIFNLFSACGAGLFLNLISILDVNLSWIQQFFVHELGSTLLLTYLYIAVKDTLNFLNKGILKRLFFRVFTMSHGKKS